jgi:hypothetical protein
MPLRKFISFHKKIGHNDSMDSIEYQLEFIEKHAINERNPVKMLSPDQEFKPTKKMIKLTSALIRKKY